MNLGVMVDRVLEKEKREDGREKESVWFNSEIKQGTRDRLKRVAEGLRDYRLHVLHQKPNIRWKRFKSLKLFDEVVVK
jgi:hypothetical protein